jgi:hypothetical protein
MEANHAARRSWDSRIAARSRRSGVLPADPELEAEEEVQDAAGRTGPMATRTVPPRMA